jgi:DNA polymerase-3 subunit gamma/tau
MLSTQAFNGLLKTLEEPPPHVKFVFATTEARKVPVTVLSRCQKFDLRRVEEPVLAAHLAGICAKEAIEAEPEALGLIARAAEGSVRDSLSLLDQAIAMSEGPVTATTIRAMLGLADQTRLVALFDAATKGAAAEVLQCFAELHALGADPVAVLQDLLEISHWLSRRKLGVDAAGTRFLAVAPETIQTLAERLSMAALSRAWQILLRGIDEVRIAPDASAAAEMILLRLAAASELPPPAELMRLLQQPDRARAASPPAVTSAPPPAEPAPVASRSREPESFEELVELLNDADQKLIAASLREGAHLIRYEPGRLEFRADPGLLADLPNRLNNALYRITGRRWVVALGNAEGEPTLAARVRDRKAARIDALAADPGIRAVLEAFPGAAIVDVRPGQVPAASPDPLPLRKDQAR